MTREWLILHGGALGDLVLTIQLALRLPGVDQTAALSVISRTDPGDLSRCRPSISRRSPEGLGLHWLFLDSDDPPPERLRDAVRGRRVLNALGGTNTIVHRRLLELTPDQLHSIDPRPRADVDRHIAQQWQTQLEDQGLLLRDGVHQRSEQGGLGVPAELRDRGRAILCGHLSATANAAPSPVVIHPGSGGRSKCWPLARFVDVARGLRDGGNIEVAFIIGPVELETWPETDLAALDSEFGVLRRPDPNDLVAILAAARAFLGNDAGPAHLAALLGTPTVAIFGPTRPGVWRPLGPRVTVLDGRPDEANWGIDTDRVREALLDRLR